MQKSEIAANQQVSLSILGWLGGIVDGEGHISLLRRMEKNGKPNGYIPEIGITNIDPLIINHAVRILQLREIPFFIQKHKGNKNWKERLEITIAGFKRVSRALPLISPYLVAKSEKANILEKYVSYRLSLPHHSPITDVDHLTYQKMRELNR